MIAPNQWPFAPILTASSASYSSMSRHPFHSFRSPSLALALVVFPLVGLSRSALDVAGRMQLQRVAPQEVMASVFAAVEALGLIASLVGCVIAQVVIATSGARAALGAISVATAVVIVFTARHLFAADQAADAPIVAIRLLRRIPVFSLLPGPAIEAVARAAKPVRVCGGQTIVRPALDERAAS